MNGAILPYKAHLEYVVDSSVAGWGAVLQGQGSRNFACLGRVQSLVYPVETVKLRMMEEEGRA